MQPASCYLAQCRHVTCRTQIHFSNDWKTAARARTTDRCRNASSSMPHSTSVPVPCSIRATRAGSLIGSQLQAPGLGPQLQAPGLGLLRYIPNTAVGRRGMYRGGGSVIHSAAPGDRSRCSKIAALGGTCLAWWAETGNTSRQSHWISAPGSRPWSLEVHPQHCSREAGNVWGGGGGPSYILRPPMQLHEKGPLSPMSQYLSRRRQPLDL